MSEKKKGFWSWLGFGKKEEPQQEAESSLAKQAENARSENIVEQVESIAEKIEENVTQTAETVATQVEERAEEFGEVAVEMETRFADSLEETVEDAEIFAEKATEKAKTFVEETTEEVETFAENTAEAVETLVEEKVDDLGEIVQAAEDIVAEKAAEAEAKIDEKIDAVLESETLEQAVENLQHFANGEGSLNEPTHIVEPIAAVVETVTADDYQEKPSKGGFFRRLIQGLIKTKQNIGSGFRNFFRGKKIDDELFEELEEQLLVADLGMPTTQKIITNLTQHASRQQLKDADLLYQQLKVELGEVLKPVAQPLVIEPKKPYVILMVGVNGVGKTTTIGKLARKFQNEGKSVMLAAGDTFRAAAVEQLQVWGERNGIPVVAQSTGSDSASVIFDAMQSAAAKNIDILIADTAGRLQNKNNLMDELKKIVRVMKKYDETAPHEIMLTLDAGTGQNAISQAKLFNEAVGLTGITLTKLDGTAKGGVIFAIADQFNIPIRFIGVGEKIEDLRPFDAEEFIEALFSHEDEQND